MAQHLDHRGTMRTKSELRPASPSSFSGAQAERAVALDQALKEAGLQISFLVHEGEYAVRNGASGVTIIDGGRLYLSHLRIGKPRLRSVLRVWQKALQNEPKG